MVEVVAVIRIELSTKGLEEMRRKVAQLDAKNLGYALSRAVNDTAAEVAKGLNTATTSSRYFDQPVKPFTQRAFAVTQRSSRYRLEAEVAARPIQARYLTPSIRGGRRPQRPSESRLLAGSNLPAWSPGSGARRTAGGDISVTTLAKAVAGASTARSGYFRLDEQRGKLPPGIYQQAGKRKVKQIIKFQNLPIVPRRFPIDDIALQIIDKQWPLSINNWIEKVWQERR